LLSSIEAFARTLRVHRDSIGREAARVSAAAPSGTRPEAETPQPSAGTFPLLAESPGPDDEARELTEQELAAREDEQVRPATPRATVDDAPAVAAERALLDEMTNVAEAARGLPD